MIKSELVGTIWDDFRYVLRVLRKSPAFTIVAILSLALGIGANTAVFSVVNAVLIRSLPYPAPNQLVRIDQQGTQGALSITEFEFCKEHGTTFSSIAGYRGVGDRHMIWDSHQEWVKAMTVTVDFARVLGTDLVLGRDFSAEETHAGGPLAIIITDSFWHRAFGGDPDVLGHTVALDGVSYVIIGVLPRSFWFPQAVDVLTPLRPAGGLSDLGTNTQLIARLKRSSTLLQARSEMAALSESFRRTYADHLGPKYPGFTAISFQEWLVGATRLNVLLLFGATGFLLLIACVNLASLLLARSSSRRREIAVRLALGSDKTRLLRQFAIENFVICMLGTFIGLGATYGLLRAFLTLIPFHLPTSVTIQVDGLVLSFTILIAIVTAILFTLVPFFTMGRLNVYDALKTTGRTTGSGGSSQNARSLLVISEVAISTTLLIAAGLLIHSLYRLHQQQLGFNPRNLVTFETPLESALHQNAISLSMRTTSMLEALRSSPGIQEVAGTNLLPMSGRNNFPTEPVGYPERNIGGTEVRLITPDYFKALEISLLHGRSFTERDTRLSTPVAIVNEKLAKAWWPGSNVLSNRVIVGRYKGRELLKDLPREVVGIVGDTKVESLRGPSRPTIFIPLAQASDDLALGTGSLAWIIKTAAPIGVAGGLRHTIVQLDPTQRIRAFRTMDAVVDSDIASSRFDAWLFGIFAGIALALAVVGLFGLLSYSVSQRREEIGIRMAVGAQRSDVLVMILKDGLILTSIGLVIGVVGALWLSHFLSALLYGVPPTDLVSVVAVCCLLLLIGAATSYIPARRATNIDPMIVLRYE